MSVLIDWLLDSLFDTAKLLPFLFLTYLFLEWLEKPSEAAMKKSLEKHQKAGPLVGSLLGIIPECGFSSAASSLYATGIIRAGTLIAVYLSTSDEMLPILLSSSASFQQVGSILLVKVVVACVFGYLAELFFRKPKGDIESFCKQEHCHCEDGVFVSALRHTLTIGVWLFAITAIMNGVVNWIGLDTLQAFVQRHPASTIWTSSLIGMIPSCASSVLLSKLYLDSVISFAAVCAGLLANAGVGMLVLFRVHKNQKQNLAIIGYVWLVSWITGVVLQMFA